MITTELYGGRLKINHNPESKVQRYKVVLDGEDVKWPSVSTVVGIKDKSMPMISWATDLYRDFLIDKLSGGITLEHIVEGASLHKVRKEEAADVGTQIHGWVEAHVKSILGTGDHPEMPNNPAIEIGVNAWLDFEEQHKVKYHSTERIVASIQHGFQGRMDYEVTIDNKRAILDLKSSNGLYNGVRMQDAAYAKADEEEQGKKIYKAHWAVRVAKETEEEYIKRMEKKGKIVYPPYKVFEAINLTDHGSIDDDFEGFLGALKLYNWDKKTDFYLNKIN